MLPWFSLSWTGSADKNGLHQINPALSVLASSRYHQMFSSTPNHTSRLSKMDIQGGTPCKENTWEVWGCWVLGRNPSGFLSSSFRVCKMKVMILGAQGSFYVSRSQLTGTTCVALGKQPNSLELWCPFWNTGIRAPAMQWCCPDYNEIKSVNHPAQDPATEEVFKKINRYHYPPLSKRDVQRLKEIKYRNGKVSYKFNCPWLF